MRYSAELALAVIVYEMVHICYGKQFDRISKRFFICVFTYMYICTQMCALSLWRPQEGVGFPGARVGNDCNSLLGARNL